MKETDLKKHLQEAKSHLENELSKLKTGRASAAMVEDIMVEAYEGTDKLMLKEVASITVGDGQSILIAPWDKSITKRIEDGILKSNRGFNPINQGDAIRINMPEMTEETRKETAKRVKSMVEESKISVRNIRQNAINALKEQFEEKMLTEDEYHKKKDHIDDLVKETNKELEDIGKSKEEEIMTI